MYTDQATIDTGSPASFINKKTADVLLKSGASVKLLSTSELPIDTHYVDYNRRTIKLFGTLIADVFSLGSQTNSAKFLVSENRTRCLLNVDLQSSLGVKPPKQDQLLSMKFHLHQPTQPDGVTYL